MQIDSAQDACCDPQGIKNIIVVDLEATCDRGRQLPRSEMEIIEIGAVVADVSSGVSSSEFQCFVRPVRHPQLTPFCEELTSISQRDVDGAAPFPEAILGLVAWSQSLQLDVYASWGMFDQTQMKRDCRFHQTPFPLPSRHLNLKQLFSKALGTRRSYGMAGALRLVGLDLQGTHHRGLDDARNIARLLPYALGRKAIVK